MLLILLWLTCPSNTMFHQFNIGLHVFSGSVALILGLLAIIFSERTRLHRKLGKAFLYALSIVVATGFVGWLLFRSDAFLLMLTIISGYEGFAGYRIVKMKEKHPGIVDFLVAAGALLTGVLYVYLLSVREATMSSSVV